MDLIVYVGKKVKIILNNDYYFVGKIIDADENSLDMIDKENKRVSLSKDMIASIQEIGR